MLGGVAEYIFGGLVVLIAVALWIAKQWGASQQLADDNEDDLTAVSRIMKEAEDAAKTRAEAERLTRSGIIPNRLHKYYRD